MGFKGFILDKVEEDIVEIMSWWIEKEREAED